ncbi:MAG: hypothetical protein IJM76_02015 [Lachnospiraceae bacterium]|nr:hypothetical protein [Lachnospiraceae bacterium]
MAKIRVDTAFPKFPVERKIFGHFTEHAFGNIYGGFYDPESARADEDGLRTDVIELLKRVKVPILRYPGGNFVSNYHWEDGIGPKEERKRRLEYAWGTEESNQFGTADFIKLCRKVGAEPLICVNMGSGTPEEAMHWVEYCNGTGDTWYANLRRSHGYEEPFNVKYWGLGNEMWGNFQMQNLSAEDYGKYAFQFAKAIKWADRSVKLVACGLSDSAEWNYTVMKAIGPMCDYISAHHYSIGWGPFHEGDYLEHLYIPEYLEAMNTLTVSTIYAGLNDVSRRCKVAWDEWNMYGWVFQGVNDDAHYTMENAVITALVLNRFLRNSDTIGMANYSTFVNINGAVSVHGDETVCRAQYPVFELLANNTGDEVLDVKLDVPELKIPYVKGALGRNSLGIDLTGPDVLPDHTTCVPALDCLATRGADGTVYLSIVNKSPDEDLEVTVEFPDLPLSGKAAEMKTVFHEDLQAANTLEHPDTVAARDAEAPQIRENSLRTVLRKHSVNLIVLK